MAFHNDTDDDSSGPSFTLSTPSSAYSSRSSSPAPSENNHNSSLYAPVEFPGSPTSPFFPKEFSQLAKLPVEERQVPDVYDATLSPWRAAIRRKLLVAVERESKIIARMQDYVRTPQLDAYFVYTSSLGTHTFFMTVLPGLFFFGYEEIGRGLLLVLASGVYFSSVVKDLICSPRPFAPPVTRLTIGTHHLEYGFPSTHSTNSVSIALYFFSHVHRVFAESSPNTYYILSAILVLYTFSIVYGRIYTAMHSFTDCIMGVLMGAALWWAHDSYWGGFGAGKWVEVWCKEGGWSVPAITITLTLLLVNQHPQPVDDCPCFEDAIAFVSVVAGSLLARWHAIHWSFAESFFTTIMPGSLSLTWEQTFIWWSIAALKMVFGVLVITLWRLLAKSTLHLVLPPTFRLLGRAVRLPHRRFYTPATDYKNMPSEFALHDDGHGGLGGLRAVPSLIDLPGGVAVEDSDLGATPATNGIKYRSSNLSKEQDEKTYSVHWGAEEEHGKPDGVKHYDADVLTKVIVYAGISILSCEVVPIIFEKSGLGVKSWV